MQALPSRRGAVSASCAHQEQEALLSTLVGGSNDRKAPSQFDDSRLIGIVAGTGYAD